MACLAIEASEVSQKQKEEKKEFRGDITLYDIIHREECPKEVALLSDEQKAIVDPASDILYQRYANVKFRISNDKWNNCTDYYNSVGFKRFLPNILPVEFFLESVSKEEAATDLPLDLHPEKGVIRMKEDGQKITFDYVEYDKIDVKRVPKEQLKPWQRLKTIYSEKKTIHKFILTCKSDRYFDTFSEGLFSSLPDYYKARVSLKQYVKIYPDAIKDPTKLAATIAKLQQASKVAKPDENASASMSPESLAYIAALVSKE